MILGINGSDPSWMDLIVTGDQNTNYNNNNNIDKLDINYRSKNTNYKLDRIDIGREQQINIHYNLYVDLINHSL